ncbi:MAG: hypothetical protein ACH34X_01455 [Thiolinea sp.]
MSITSLPIPKNILDVRHRFREVFQAVRSAYPQANILFDLPAEQALRKFADEQSTTGQAVYLGAPRLDLHYVIITGLVADCLSHQVTPFHRARQYLHERGFTSSVLKVNGRSSSQHNAAMIQQALTAFPPKHRFVLLGYSKGAVDALQALITYPGLCERVAAVVSLAGAIGGSPLVETTPAWLKWLFAKLPLPGCQLGDGAALQSLDRIERKQWLATHNLPAEIRYFSLVALPEPEQVSRILRLNHRKLAQFSLKNDSQVLAEDALIPGSDLLGYANADHWALTLPLAHRWPFLRFLLDKNDYPREILLESIVRYVEERLLSNDTSSV